MHIKTLPLGPISANCYIICDDEKNGAVIDPGGFNVRLIDEILKSGIKNLEYIICTHGHFDHIAGVSKLKEKYPDAKVVIGSEDAPCLSDGELSAAAVFGFETDPCYADITVKDEDKLTIGKNEFLVVGAPGHTPGGIILYSEENKCAFTGDTLFKDSVGRTDLPGGNHLKLMESVKKIKSFVPDTVLYCGHGPSTTVTREMKYNFYLL